MFNKINFYLEKIYKFSGYVAAIFLIFIAIFILLGIPLEYLVSIFADYLNTQVIVWLPLRSSL